MNGPDGQDGSSLVADRLLARERTILERYRTRLEFIRSPLVASEDIWQQCVLQARNILSDCALSMTRGAPVVSDGQIDLVAALGGDRVRQGVHLVHSIRAGLTLVDLVLDEIESCFADPLVPMGPYGAAVRALQQGVIQRLEVGALGYDSFLLERLGEIREQATRNLARDIHDQIGNSLSLALRQIELYERVRGPGGHADDKHVLLAKASIIETMRNARDLVSGLRSTTVTGSGSLELALQAFTASMGDVAQSVQIWVRGSEDWVPGPIAEELFITVRECLRNAFSHAIARNILVQINIAPHEIQTEVIDDGVGFDIATVQAESSSNGLAGMRERIELLCGTLNMISAPGKGTHLTIWIPIVSDRTVS
jgi:signal transduction histidine kinase